MTAHVNTTLTCERPGCTARFHDAGWPGEVRTAARAGGWTTDDGDRCPAHPSGGEPPPPSLLDELDEAATTDAAHP